MDKKRTAAPDINLETDRQFLERNGVTEQIREVLTKIIQNRPEDPIDFLADFFETFGDKNDRVTKAYEQVKLTHHSKPAFHTNIRIAYDLLGQSKVDRRGRPVRREPGKSVCRHFSITGRQLKGVTGNTYGELLAMLTNDFPLAVREKLMKKIQCRDFEVVVFDVFKSGIFTCLVLQDFLQLSHSLFVSLDSSKSGAIDKVLGDVIMLQLSKAVSNTDRTKPASVLEGGYLLSPDKLYSSIATSLPNTKSLFNTKPSANKTLMTEDDFVSGAADSFLNKVENLR